jgi:mannose/fructose/sorbose-specific phosphotransferase system IIA component
MEGGWCMSKKIAVILTSHGDMAKGVLQSATMIFGHQDNVVADIFPDGTRPEDLRNHYEESIASFGDDAQVLFMCDIWGGTPFNQASQLVAANPDRMALVTGLNLPMLIECYTARPNMELAELAQHLVATVKDQIKQLDVEALLSDDEDDDLL